MRVLWLERAEADLTELVDYLLARHRRAALRVYEAVRDQVALFADHPELGRLGRVPATRELVIARTPYIAVYTVDRDADAVIVLRVLHGARRWPDAFL